MLNLRRLLAVHSIHLPPASGTEVFASYVYFRQEEWLGVCLFVEAACVGLPEFGTLLAHIWRLGAPEVA